jgi:hypothetical protein
MIAIQMRYPVSPATDQFGRIIVTPTGKVALIDDRAPVTAVSAVEWFDAAGSASAIGVRVSLKTGDVLDWVWDAAGDFRGVHPPGHRWEDVLLRETATAKGTVWVKPKDEVEVFVDLTDTALCACGSPMNDPIHALSEALTSEQFIWLTQVGLYSGVQPADA